MNEKEQRIVQLLQNDTKDCAPVQGIPVEDPNEIPLAFRTDELHGSKKASDQKSSRTSTTTESTKSSIVRVKRKRDMEPLPVLLVEQSPAKKKLTAGVYRLQSKEADREESLSNSPIPQQNVEICEVDMTFIPSTSNPEDIDFSRLQLETIPYVYDTYILETVENLESFLSYQQGVGVLVWDEHEDRMVIETLSDQEDSYYDDEDSNAENYWTNDYPDEGDDYLRDMLDEDDVDTGESSGYSNSSDDDFDNSWFR